MSTAAHPTIRQMRVRLVKTEEACLYVRPEDGTEGEGLLRVRCGHRGTGQDLSQATMQALWPGVSLNLLDVSVGADGTLTPDIVVLEPDYLMDISVLAQCFRPYGHHPAGLLLSRLGPAESTAPMLLGNIANLFLDEWIHAAGGEDVDYRTCMTKAFHLYPLELATCPELRDPLRERHFFADCHMHFAHIRDIVTRTMADPVYGLDRRDAVIEPSYICEALGLQGRLDYMQRDMSAFIEMKSGKADEYARTGHIVPREDNTVQMLLYQAVLRYAMDAGHARPYLLYTRYPLLIPAQPSPDLLREAIGLRNLIVAADHAVSQADIGHTIQQLLALSADMLNERHLSGRLWQQYLRPGIDSVCRHIHALPQIELKYLAALYGFITREQYAAKTGGTASLADGTRGGAASLWRATLDEKRETGAICLDLVITQNQAALPHCPRLLLRYDRSADPSADKALPPPDFRPGDAVVLYERNHADDNAIHKLVFKGNIEWITEEAISLRLRSRQENTQVLPVHSHYALEHDYMDTSFRYMYQGLADYLQATPRRRALITGGRPPETDPAQADRIAAATDDLERIVQKALAARDCFLLMGPPGTGKTSHALRLMAERMYAAGQTLLLTAYTNRAVDEICKALSAIRPRPDYIRVGSELACHEDYRNQLMENVIQACVNRREVHERLSACRIFVGTTMAFSSARSLFRLKRFDTAIVDEATQILEPQLLSLLCMRNATTGQDAIGRFVLIGDHKQLPAVVTQPEAQSAVTDPDLQAIGLRNLRDSLFERLYRQARADGHTACIDMLCRQGRMHPEVAEFANQAFYGGQLRPLGLPHQLESLHEACPDDTVTDRYDALMSRRVAFLPAPADTTPQGSAKVSSTEARIVARLAATVYHRYATDSDSGSDSGSDSSSGSGPSSRSGFDPGRTLGIITPYRNQIALIRREIEALHIAALKDIAIDTVERYQGSERDVIIYSFCVSQSWQLEQLACLTEEDGQLIDRKLNVALTRARKQLFLVGNPALLCQNPIYARLVQRYLDKDQTIRPSESATRSSEDTIRSSKSTTPIT